MNSSTDPALQRKESHPLSDEKTRLSTQSNMCTVFTKLQHSNASQQLEIKLSCQTSLQDMTFGYTRPKTMTEGIQEHNVPPLCETPSHANSLNSGDRCILNENTMETQSEAGKRKKGTRRGTLNAEAKNVLKAWMFSPEHFAHPYPSEEEKEELAAEAGIEVKQLSNWFTNARKRLWQPVLRQSGVEVKNFLSTGRGGPRGQKLEVPPNIHLLVGSYAGQSPPSTISRKRSFDSEFDEDSDDGHLKYESVDCYTTTKRLQTSENMESPSYDRISLMWHNTDVEKNNSVVAHPIWSSFHEQEIKAAESLLGLHIQCQSVH